MGLRHLFVFSRRFLCTYVDDGKVIIIQIIYKCAKVRLAESCCDPRGLSLQNDRKGREGRAEFP